MALDRAAAAAHSGLKSQRPRALLVALAVQAGCMSPASAQAVWTAANGSWFDAANWSTAVVPGAGSSVIVSNGGTAVLDPLAPGGAAATPSFNALSVGLTSSGTGAGRVRSVGSTVNGGSLSVGFGANNAGSFADGLIDIQAADLNVSSARIGTMINQTLATTVSGQVLVDGHLQVSAGTLEVAQLSGSPAGSRATGDVTAKDLSGLVLGGFLIVGNVTSNSDASIGNESTGRLVATEGGNLTLLGGLNTVVGTTFGADRVTDVAGTRINQATGLMQLAGTVATAGDQGALLVGRGFGGRVDGTLELGTLAMGSDRFNGVSVGTSSVDGVSKGRVVVGSGDLNHAGSLSVGTTNGGMSEGSVQLAGALRGAGAAIVGSATDSAGRVVKAEAGVTASGGVSGYSSYTVGLLTGNVGAGSSAKGLLAGDADVGAAAVSFFARVGVLVNTTGAGDVEGELRLGGGLGLVNGALEVAQVSGAAAGSSARGVVRLAGDVGQVGGGGFLIVGNVTSNSDASIGNRSFGELVAAGGAQLQGGLNTVVGTTFGSDRVDDADGTRINEASGVMRIAGTVTTLADQGNLLVGRSFNGRADGTLEVGHLDMAAGRFSLVNIGTSTGGAAVGQVTVGGGALRAQTVNIGVSNGGTADGRLRLDGAGLEADNVRAGQGTGTATIELRNSQAQVAEDFDLQNGTMSLHRSLLNVGDEFVLGAGATLSLDIEGLLRGTEFGAIDTLLASLDGQLALDLSALAFDVDSMFFDLIYAGEMISGDFAGFSFVGLDQGYVATTGIFDFGDGEVYRLMLTRGVVPEPASLLLVLAALLVLGASRRRTPAKT